MKARHLFAATVVVLAGLAAPSAAAAQSADPTGVETTLKTSAHPKHHGRIRLKQVPTQLTMETIGDYRVHLSRWLRHQTLQLQYQGPKGRWRKVVDVEAAGRALVSFQAVVPGTVGGVSVGFRFVTLGSRRIAKATSKVWRIPVYRTFPLAQLTPVSGSLVVTSEVGGGQYVAPAGSGPTVTSTLALPENCGRISFSLFVRPDLVQPEDAFNASVAVDGVTIYTHAPADGQQYADLPITLPPHPKLLTLTASYDATRPEHRPWFASNEHNSFVGARSPRVFCATAS